MVHLVHVNISNKERESIANPTPSATKKENCLGETRKGSCSFTWLLKQICFVAGVVVVSVILLVFEHVSAQILVQVFLKTDLERPRPHGGQD